MKTTQKSALRPHARPTSRLVGWASKGAKVKTGPDSPRRHTVYGSSSKGSSRSSGSCCGCC
uniref:Uncharacterized protein n=1 Tax=Anopheles albimanus TaxID=7167 RepID=A0A182FDC6_ANOAL